MNWALSIASLFARPLGALINNGLTAASAIFIAWSTKQGLPSDMASTIAAGVVLALSSAISGLAATQGVQIPIINADPTNGVKVVPTSSPTPAVSAPGK